MFWLERNYPWVVITIVAVFGIGLWVGYRDMGDKFKEACTSAGGSPVFDGRQWQCLRK